MECRTKKRRTTGCRPSAFKTNFVLIDWRLSLSEIKTNFWVLGHLHIPSHIHFGTCSYIHLLACAVTRFASPSATRFTNHSSLFVCSLIRLFACSIHGSSNCSFQTCSLAWSLALSLARFLARFYNFPHYDLTWPIAASGFLASKVKCWKWNVESEMLKVKCWKWNVKSEMLKVKCWKWNVEKSATPLTDTLCPIVKISVLTNRVICWTR